MGIVVRVPTVEQEDERRLSRERERLQKEIFGHTNRIRSLLVTQGIQEKLKQDVSDQLEAMELPPQLKQELHREAERLVLARRQLAELDAQRRQRLSEAQRALAQQAELDAQQREIERGNRTSLVREPDPSPGMRYADTEETDGAPHKRVCNLAAARMQH